MDWLAVIHFAYDIQTRSNGSLISVAMVCTVSHHPRTSSNNPIEALLEGCKVPNISWEPLRAIALSEVVSL